MTYNTKLVDLKEQQEISSTSQRTVNLFNEQLAKLGGFRTKLLKIPFRSLRY